MTERPLSWNISSLALQRRRFVWTLFPLTKSSVTGGEVFSLVLDHVAAGFSLILIILDACASSVARLNLTRQRLFEWDVTLAPRPALTAVWAQCCTKPLALYEPLTAAPHLRECTLALLAAQAITGPHSLRSRRSSITMALANGNCVDTSMASFISQVTLDK